jgi:hypothetical protein
MVGRDHQTMNIDDFLFCKRVRGHALRQLTDLPFINTG